MNGIRFKTNKISNRKYNEFRKFKFIRWNTIINSIFLGSQKERKN